MEYDVAVLIIEICIVLAAFTAMVASAVKLARQAAELARAAKKLQEQAQPKTRKLTAQADMARELGLRVSERSDLLQRRSEVLSVTMGRMMVLVNAASEAKRRLNKITSYIGF